MNDKIIYWKELSDYDLETANAMLNSGRYLYVVIHYITRFTKVFFP